MPDPALHRWTHEAPGVWCWRTDDLLAYVYRAERVAGRKRRVAWFLMDQLGDALTRGDAATISRAKRIAMVRLQTYGD